MCLNCKLYDLEALAVLLDKLYDKWQDPFALYLKERAWFLASLNSIVLDTMYIDAMESYLIIGCTKPRFFQDPGLDWSHLCLALSYCCRYCITGALRGQKMAYNIFRRLSGLHSVVKTDFSADIALWFEKGSLSSREYERLFTIRKWFRLFSSGKGSSEKVMRRIFQWRRGADCPFSRNSKVAFKTYSEILNTTQCEPRCLNRLALMTTEVQMMSKEMLAKLRRCTSAQLNTGRYMERS